MFQNTNYEDKQRINLAANLNIPIHKEIKREGFLSSYLDMSIDFNKAIDIEGFNPFEVNEQEEIAKGFISNLEYSTGDLNKFQKTGKEIKEKLAAYITNLEVRNSKLLGQLERLKAACDIECDSLCDDWHYRGVRDQCEEMKYFSWQVMDKLTESEMVTLNDKTFKKRDVCYEINQKTFQYCENSADIVKLNVLKNNLEDNKKFNLTLNDLVSLGF